MDIFKPRGFVERLTPLNPFERIDDGRPRVPDDLLERTRAVTTEQAWVVLREHGYHHQFEGGWIRTNPDRILIGRALTAVFVPDRPDLHEIAQSEGLADERVEGVQHNSWVIDLLQPGDVMVVDMFGKVVDGPFIGDNLATSIASRTGVGAVINGLIRDYQGIRQMEDVTFFCRGLHPSAIGDVTLAGVNIPARIGAATVMPGDLVLGTPTGLIFIPPHLAQEVVERADNEAMRDRFTRQRLSEGTYSPGVMDTLPWPDHVEADYFALVGGAACGIALQRPEKCATNGKLGFHSMRVKWRHQEVSAMRIEKKLEEMGVTLPEIPTNVDWPVIPGVQVGNLLFLTGVYPQTGSGTPWKGKVGRDYSTEEAYVAARWCANSSPRRGQVCSRGPR